MEMEERKKKIDLTDIRVVLLLAGICCFLWGSATPAIKIGYRLFGIDGADTASILLFAGSRFLLAGLLVILYHSITKRHWIWPPKGSGRAIGHLALTQTVLQYVFFYVGLSHASGVHGRFCRFLWGRAPYVYGLFVRGGLYPMGGPAKI